jgi:hypothetical protein
VFHRTARFKVGGYYEDYCVLGNNGVYFDRKVTTFWKTY